MTSVNIQFNVKYQKLFSSNLLTIQSKSSTSTFSLILLSFGVQEIRGCGAACSLGRTTMRSWPRSSTSPAGLPASTPRIRRSLPWLPRTLKTTLLVVIRPPPASCSRTSGKSWTQSSPPTPVSFFRKWMKWTLARWSTKVLEESQRNEERRSPLSGEFQTEGQRALQFGRKYNILQHFYYYFIFILSYITALSYWRAAGLTVTAELWLFRFLSSPPRLPRELLGDVGELQELQEELQEGELTDLTDQAVWAKVGNGRVKIFPLSFGNTVYWKYYVWSDVFLL